jgi:hypothetical protein
MKTLNSTSDRKNFKEFELSIDEMINVRGGESDPIKGNPTPPVVI